MNKVKNEECIFVSNKGGYCVGCGSKLIKTNWSSKPVDAYDQKTGKPLKYYVYMCPLKAKHHPNE